MVCSEGFLNRRKRGRGWGWGWGWSELDVGPVAASAVAEGYGVTGALTAGKDGCDFLDKTPHRDTHLREGAQSLMVLPCVF